MSVNMNACTANHQFADVFNAQEKVGSMLDAMNKTKGSFGALRLGLQAKRIVNSLKTLGFSPAEQKIVKLALYSAMADKQGGKRIDNAEKSALVSLVGGTVAMHKISNLAGNDLSRTLSNALGNCTQNGSNSTGFDASKAMMESGFRRSVNRGANGAGGADSAGGAEGGVTLGQIAALLGERLNSAFGKLKDAVQNLPNDPTPKQTAQLQALAGEVQAVTGALMKAQEAIEKAIGRTAGV